jgi:hypothetical protein
MKKSHKDALNHFAYALLRFLSEIHDCHNCKHPQSWVNRKGKERTLCMKYNLPIKSVRQHCIDRFPGFSNEEFEDLAEQYLTGEMALVINGIPV